jgi:hypothetical protein
MRKFIPFVIGLLIMPSSVSAQAQIVEQCPPTHTLCARMRSAAEITLVRGGIALSGGNPIVGASSTLGIRLGAIPRITIAARLTGAQLEIPDVDRAAEEHSSLGRSFNIDAAVGLFSGLSLLPTVGGFASVDVFASYGKLSLSEDEGYRESPHSWAAGVRLGILRESFTAPGVALTATYRSIGEMEFVAPVVRQGGGIPWFRLNDNSAWDARLTVGKRILMLGAVAGVGYDKYNSNVQIIDPQSSLVTDEDFDTDRTTIFANLSWTMLLLHIVTEGGLQQGGHENAFYGSLALRLAL